MVERADLAARASLALGVALTPLIFSRHSADVFNLIKLETLWVTGLAAAALCVGWSAERGVWLPRTRLGAAALVYLGVMILATVVSTNRLVSVFGLYHRYGGLISLALYLSLMFTVAAVYWERPESLKDIAWACVIAGSLVSLYVLLQAGGADWIPWKDAGTGKYPTYPIGTLGNSNFCGGYLAITLPLLAWLALTTKERSWLPVLGAAAVVEVTALWFTQTRGGMIGVIVAAVVMGVALRDRLPRIVKAIGVAGSAVAVVLAFVILIHPGSKQPPKILSSGPFRIATFEARSHYWHEALAIFAAHPMLGTGPETFYFANPRHRTPYDGRYFGLTITDKPHNVFLERASDTGALGLGSYLVLILLALVFAYRRARRSKGDTAVMAAAWLAMLVAYLAQGVFSIDVPPIVVLSWVALGAIAAIADPAVVRASERLRAAERAEPKTVTRKSKKRKRGPVPVTPPKVRTTRTGPLRRPVHAGVALAFVLLATFGVRVLVADFTVAAAEAMAGSSVSVDTFDAKYRSAIGLNSVEAVYLALAGAAAQRHVTDESADAALKDLLIRRALRYEQRAYRLQPGNVYYSVNIARVYASWAQFEPSHWADAAGWWERVVHMDPNDWEAHSQYSAVLNSTANATKDKTVRLHAAKELEISVRIKPDNSADWSSLAQTDRVLGMEEKAQQAARRALALDPNNADAKKVLGL